MSIVPDFDACLANHFLRDPSGIWIAAVEQPSVRVMPAAGQLLATMPRSLLSFAAANPYELGPSKAELCPLKAALTGLTTPSAPLSLHHNGGISSLRLSGRALLAARPLCADGGPAKPEVAVPRHGQTQSGHHRNQQCGSGCRCGNSICRVRISAVDPA